MKILDGMVLDSACIPGFTEGFTELRDIEARNKGARKYHSQEPEQLGRDLMKE